MRAALLPRPSSDLYNAVVVKCRGSEYISVKRVLTDCKSAVFIVFTLWSVSISLLRRRFSAAIKGMTCATDVSELISLVSCSKVARREIMFSIKTHWCKVNVARSS